MQGFAARRMLRVLAGGTLFLLTFAGSSPAQVFTVSPEKIEGHYLDFHPTNVPLPAQPITERGRQELIRFLTAEQGFAMRPLPRATLTLHANGDLTPGGADYVNVINEHGVSAKPGDRCVITDVKIKEDSIVLLLNGGPDPKHKWLRHVSIGMDPYNTTPVVQDSGPEPVGSRITLVFPHRVPEITGQQVEALLSPVLGFGVKSPVEAYTDTLPPWLKQAILDHHVLVGMSTQMVLYTLGQPQQKIRERDGQMPFEVWVYGEAPNPIQFVRINGNRVIRVETGEVGKPLVVRTQNEMGDYWNTAPAPNVREVKMGDQDPTAIAQQSAPKAPPTLRKPGETLPTDNDKNHPTMGPVQFPKDTSDQQQKVEPLPPPPSQQQGPVIQPQ
jgi:hypothetical protein